MPGKVKRSLVLVISGIALVLFAAFIYINNDLVLSQITQKIQKVTEQGSLSEGLNGDEEGISTPKGDLEKNEDVSTPQSDASLDSIFSKEEPVDNFDDLVE